jgi:hypothetical protein
MKRQLTITLFLMLFLWACTKVRIINPKNRFKGVTKAAYISKYSKKYKKGIAVELFFYDEKNRLKVKEQLSTPEYNMKYGVQKWISLYASNGVLHSLHVLFTAGYIKKYGTARSIRYYDKGQLKALHTLYSKDFVKTNGLSRTEMVYLETKAISKEYYSKDYAKKKGYHRVETHMMKNSNQYLRYFYSSKNKLLRKMTFIHEESKRDKKKIPVPIIEK